MKAISAIFQFLHGSVICLLPSLILIGNFYAGLSTAVISPIICAALFPINKTDRRLWMFIWASEAMTAPNIAIVGKAAPFVTAALGHEPNSTWLYILGFTLLFCVEQLGYRAVLRLIGRRTKDEETENAACIEGENDVQ